MSTNIHYLPDGRHFIINPAKESNSAAWEEKTIFIANLTVGEMRKNPVFTAKVIQQLATGMVNITNQPGKRKTKDELINLLADLGREHRAFKLLNLDKLDIHTSESGFNYKQLNVMMDSLGGKLLAETIWKLLNNNGYTDSTIIKTYLTDIYKRIRLREPEEWCVAIKHLKYLSHDMMKKVNYNSDTVVYENSRNVRPIKLAPLEKFMDNLDIDKASWKELSIFIALATGRRMGEVHGIKTIFTYIDDETVLFEGQLKTKNRPGGNPAYPIHVFCNANHLISAWERLKTLQTPKAPELVNSLLSKALSKDLPKYLKALFEDTKVPGYADDKSGITKYKDMRDFYAARMLEFRPAHETPDYFVAQCMGHGGQDLKTAGTYQKIGVV
jgi:hypothetical protein